MKRNKAILSIFLILIIILVAGASIYISSKIGQERPIAPTAPESLPKAAERTGRVVCRERPACLDAVPHPCQMAEPVEGWCPGASECVACGKNGCSTGLSCDPADGLCKKTDSTSPTVCWSGSTACTVSGVSLCVATEVKTCTPDCPVACGTAASTISTCQDSCGVATTKNCPATALCGEDGGWGELSACSATACGTSGTKTRTCNNPAPSNGGAECTRADGTLTTPSARTETTACSAAACGCTPSGVISCSPGCPTTCGLSASTISTCTDSCGSSRTKACPATAACAGSATAAPIETPITEAPIITQKPVTAQPTVLPETGILDFPGVAAFGGGLMLAVIGILLAL